MNPALAALLAVGVSAAAAAVVFLALRRIRRGRPDAAVAPPALAVGFVAGFSCVAGGPKFPPIESWHWLPTIVVLAALVGLAERRAPWTRWTLRAAAAAFAAWATDLDRTPLRIAAAVAAVLIVFAAIDGVARRGGARTQLAAVFVVLAATSATVVLSGWQTLGTACGAFAAAAGACLVLSARNAASHAGVATVAGAALSAVLMNGLFYSDTPAESAALLAAAPFAAWTPVAASDARPLRAALVRVLLVALVAGAAAVVAAVKSPPLLY